MSAIETTRFSIVKLGNSNYNIWKFKIEMLLSKDCLWSMVDEATPEVITPDWAVKNRQAMATISLSVEDGQLIHIRDCKTAQEMWLALQRLHESTNLNSKLYLLRKLYRAKLENEREMTSHIDLILDLVAQLRSIGEQIPDNHIAALMLCSLPETYAPLIAALEARPDSDMTVEFVKGRLMDEYRRRKENGAFDDTTSEKLYKITKGYQGYSKTRKETRECYNCGKIGHLKRDCRITKSHEATKHRARKVSKSGYFNGPKKGEEPDDHKEDHLCFVINDDDQPNSWCIDSGATSHMTGNREFFNDITPLETRETVRVADGRCLTVEGKGSGLLVSRLNDTCKFITINDVLYVPGLDSNLLSVKRLTQLGYRLKFEASECHICKGSELITTAKLENNLYKLHHSNHALTVKHNVHDDCMHIWHRRFGHRSPEAIQKLLRNKMVNHLNMANCNVNHILCKECIEGKMTIKPFPKHSNSKANMPYQILHSDLCGPMKTPTPSGNRYIATITDDFSRYTEVFLLKTKDQANKCIKGYLQKWNNYFGRKPLKFRSDGGGEFINRELSDYFDHHGIGRQLSAPYSPQQNGIAERRNRSILEMTRCLLLDAKLDNKYWGEAAVTAVYLQNRLPTKGCVEVTPYEAWYNRKPSVGHLRIFGSRAYTRRPNEQISKLEPRTEIGIFVGYSSEAKAYRILIPETNRIKISRSVICEEIIDDDTIEIQIDKKEHDNLSDLESGLIDRPKIETEIPEHEEPDMTEPLECLQENSQLRRSQRSTKGIAAEKLTYLSEETLEIEPSNWNEMMSLPPSTRKRWLKAVSEELNSFNKNNVWNLVTLPENKSTVGTKWMFKFKKDSKGNIIKYKACLVARGFSQVEGTDYEETYAPVVKHTTLRTLLTIAASKKLMTRHMDVKTAFLYGDLHEEIYIDQPEGQLVEGKEELVYKLNKSMYGLKQAAFEWNLKINDVLIKNGYSRGNSDPCLYSKLADHMTSYILIYVDDLLVCSDSNDEIRTITNTLRTKFEMKDLGQIRYYLGIDIQQKDDNYIMLQTDKINQMLREYRLQDSNTSDTPMDSDYLKQRNIDSRLLPGGNLYRQAVGALLHLASVSRPDISVAVGLLGRNTNQPNDKDWIAVKHVIKYLKGTSNLGVVLSGGSPLSLSGYVDSDWAGDSSDRKSTSGYVFFLGDSPISWSSRKQTCVSMSSTEAEYVAAASACQELLWLKLLMNDFGIEQKYPIVMHEDNQGCIKLTENNKYRARSKHIDIKFHLLIDLSQKEVVKLTFCSTEKMVADILTKPLCKQSFLALRGKLGLGTVVC